MNNIFSVLVAVSFLSALYHVDCLTNVVTHSDQARLTTLLQDGLTKPDLESLFYSIAGLKSVGKDVPDAESLCNAVSTKIDKNDIGSILFGVEVRKMLTCKFEIPDANTVISGFVTEDSDVKTLASAIIAKALLGLKVDATEVSKLESALRKDDSPASAGYAFYAASIVGKEISTKNIVEMVEDIVAQAEEIDGTVLQFDGGLEVTSKVLKGALLLSIKEKKALLTQEQCLKFAQYFVNRKYVAKVKDAYNLLSVLALLAENDLQIPIAVSLFGTMIINDKNPTMKVRVTDVLDRSVQGATVTALSLKGEDDNILIENEVFKQGPEDDYVIIDSPIARGYVAANTFVMDVMGKKPSKGMYNCALNIAFKKEEKRYIGGTEEAVKIKVVARVIVDDAEVAVVDKDRSSSPSTSKIKFPEQLSTELEADYHQKILMNFVLKDMASGDLVTAHQVFVRLTHIGTGQEIFFVAEPEDSNVYQFNLDIGATGKDSFNNLGGKYKMDLIVGDAAIQIPIKWNVGVVSLTFMEETKKTPKQERVLGPKPVIEHMFRVPEKRPPKGISNAFTGLVTVPFILMFALWIKVGANFSNFNFSISTLVFHIGLAGIFVLYFFFWYKLNMFQTLKYLAVIGGLTFLGGNKMLADMAEKKQSRS